MTKLLDRNKGAFFAAAALAIEAAAFAVLLTGALGRSEVRAQAPTTATHVKKVLLYDRNLSTSHPEWPSVRRSFGRLATRYGFQLDTSNAVGYVNATTLQGVDVLVISQSSGVVLDAASEAAVRNFLEVQGKALLMIHAAASMSLPCPTAGEAENLNQPNCYFLVHAVARKLHQHNEEGTVASIMMDSVCAGAVPPGAPAGSVEASALNHGLCNVETKSIYTGLPRRVNGMYDEWYAFRNRPRAQAATVVNGVTHGPVNVLVSLDESTYAPISPAMGDHPIVWTRKVGNGLAALNSMGHSDIFIRNDSVVEKLNWRLLRYLARDFVGCMDPAYAEYNPEATVTALTPIDTTAPKPANPCVTPVSIHPLKGKTFNGITVAAGGIRIATPEKGTYRVVVSDGMGRRLFSCQFSGGSGFTRVKIPGLADGSRVIVIHDPKGGMTATRLGL